MVAAGTALSATATAVHEDAEPSIIEKRLDVAPGGRVRVGKQSLGEMEIDQLIEKRETEIERLSARVANLPKQVPLDTVLAPDAIVQLERERKVLVDAVKLTAYRAESALARIVEPLLARHDDEARKFLKTIFSATADVIPDQRAGRLLVRFHGLASPRATRALAELCDLINASPSLYPGTALRLRFEAPTLQE